MKKSMRIALLFLSISAMIITGCSLLSFMKSPSNIMNWITIPAEDTEYLTNTITYLNGIEQNEMEEIFTVTDVEDLEGEAYFILEDTYENEMYYIIDKNDGFLIASDDDDVDDNDYVILSIPIEVGNDWAAYEGADYEMEITNIDAVKTVDAGTYNDIIIVKTEYETVLGDYEYEYWFSQSLGITIYSRSEFTDTLDDILVIETELKNID